MVGFSFALQAKEKTTITRSKAKVIRTLVRINGTENRFSGIIAIRAYDTYCYHKIIMTSVPQRIGNYQLERQIGKGGMSEVWLGRHRSLENRLIAIKLLLSQDSEWIERFTREANITSRLRHEHIVQIFDHGYQPPYHYTIME